MARYLLILFIVMMAVIGAAWVWVVQCPMSFLDNSYPVLKAKMDMAAHLPEGSVVILGDSRAQVGMVPAQLGPDVYNLAFSGDSPIEVLALARLALAGPHPPRAVIISLAPFRIITDASFWENSVRFGLLDPATVDEIWHRSRQYPDDLVLGTVGYDHLDAASRSPLFGPKTLGDVEARLKKSLYGIRFPSVYFAALESGGINQREAFNLATYRGVLDSRGHKLLWMADGSHDLSAETRAASFAPSPLLDSYLAETLDLFQQRNIPVYFIACPLNDDSAAALHPGFADEFDAYIRGYEKSHAHFHVLGKTLTIRPWTDFGGDGHLNAKGAQAFSRDVADLLRQAGVEP